MLETLIHSAVFNTASCGDIVFRYDIMMWFRSGSFILATSSTRKPHALKHSVLRIARQVDIGHNNHGTVFYSERNLKCMR